MLIVITVMGQSQARCKKKFLLRKCIFGKTPFRFFVTLVAGDLGGVDEAGVDPAGHAVLLLPRRVGTLSGLRVVVGPVERHELVPLAVRVEHLVALADGDLVHLDGAARLAGHQDLRGYHLEQQRQG